MASLVGITEFLSETRRIGGRLKEKCSDFVVKEIDLKGCVAEITGQVFIKKEEVKVESAEISEENVEKIKERIGQELCDKVIALAQRIGGGEYESILEIPSPDDKEERTKIHFTIKELAPMLTSCTEKANNIIRIYSSKLAQSFNKRQKLNLDSRGAKKTPSKYIQFTLNKQNLDTAKALKILGKATGIKDKSFGIAGNKDKKALTSQNVTAFANYLDKLQHAKLPENMQIGDFKYSDTELKIGDLQGNRFELIIRQLACQDELHISQLIETLKQKGFINYFGLQRFGNSAENATHTIGLAILTKNYQKAVDIILGPRPVKNEDENRARTNWIAHRDVDRALQEFPIFCVKNI